MIGDPMSRRNPPTEDQLRKAANRFRAAATVCANALVHLSGQPECARPARTILNEATVEMFALIRELEDEDEEFTPVRTPSRALMRAVKGTDGPGRY